MKSDPQKKTHIRTVKTSRTPANPPAKAKTSTKTRTASAATRPSTAKAKPPPKIPAILLEGDEPSPTTASGPGERYALGPIPPGGPESPEAAELPEAYGTQRLLLTARDPHWLYAAWDLTREQQKKYNSLSADRHLVLRIFKNEFAGPPCNETHEIGRAHV